jgi:hypothetical protein
MSFQEYSKIQSEYSTYSPQADIGNEYKKAAEKLKTLRSKTAPAEDIQKLRKDILEPTTGPPVLFIQVALFLVFLSLLAYLILPIGYAHGIVFLLLCVGIALGIFLRK